MEQKKSGKAEWRTQFEGCLLHNSCELGPMFVPNKVVSFMGMRCPFQLSLVV